MFNCLLIILVIGSCVTFGGFPSRFSKCCFHCFILSCWFAPFNFALIVLFLLLTSFIVCQAILDFLSFTESLILLIGLYQVLSRRARVDLGAMAMKGCSVFPKAPALLEPHHQIVKCLIQDTHGGRVLPLCRSAVGVFYSPNRLGKFTDTVYS